MGRVGSVRKAIRPSARRLHCHERQAPLAGVDAGQLPSDAGALQQPSFDLNDLRPAFDDEIPLPSFGGAFARASDVGALRAFDGASDALVAAKPLASGGQGVGWPLAFVVGALWPAFAGVP